MKGPDRIGDVLLGKYRAVGLLGEGGMGRVYAAEDIRLGREVAVKVLHNTAPVQSRRLKREAQVIAKVTHPNLVTLLEYDVLADGAPCLVMERVRGESLRNLMANHRFSIGEIFSFLRQSLSALEACHREGIVHRDLKPENVLMVPGAGGFTVKIIDFGLTKLMAGDQSVLTLQGEVFGSPRFMAPEQWFKHPVDGRTDLYALALMGFCMILGDHFIPWGNPVDVCTAHVHAQRPALGLTTCDEPVPLRVAAALHRAADPEIDSRFRDARTMLRALEGEALMPAVASSRVALAETADLPVSILATAFNKQVLFADEHLFDEDATAVQASMTESVSLAAGSQETVIDPNLAAAVKAAMTPKPVVTENLVDVGPPPVEHSAVIERVQEDAIVAINRSKVDMVRAISGEIGDDALAATLPPPDEVEPRVPTPGTPTTPDWGEPAPERSNAATMFAVGVGLAAVAGAAWFLF